MESFFLLLLLAKIDIPHAYFDEIKSIEFHSESGYLEIDGKKEEISGLSKSKTGEIDIYALAYNIQTPIHEIGHVKCNKMGNPKPFGEGDSISAYGRTNAKEDCAETFMAYYLREHPDTESGENARCDLPRLRTENPDAFKKCLVIRRWDIAERAKYRREFGE